MPPSTVSDPAYYTAAMSYHEWKREATIPQILFGLHCPYGKPSSPIARFFWRRRIWIEATFALSMMEPWERFIVSEYHIQLYYVLIPRVRMLTARTHPQCT